MELHRKITDEQGEVGLLDRHSKNLIVRKLGKESLKRVPDAYQSLTKKIKHKKISKILDSDFANSLVKKCSQYSIDRL